MSASSAAAIRQGTSAGSCEKSPIHLEHEVGAVRQCPPEAGEVGRAEALLAPAVEDVDEAQLGAELLRELARSVGPSSITSTPVPSGTTSARRRSIGSRFSRSL